MNTDTAPKSASVSIATSAAPPASCDEWKAAYCRKRDACAPGEVDCAEFLRNFACSAEAPLGECVRDLDAAACGALPLGCDAEDVADPAEAIQKCNAFGDAYCAWFVGCGKTAAACEANVSLLRCPEAISFSESYDLCLEEMGDLSCSAPRLPESCDALIKTQ